MRSGLRWVGLSRLCGMVMMFVLSFVCVEGGDMDIDMDMVGGMKMVEGDDEDNVLLTSVMIELPHPRRVLLECRKCSERHGVVFTPHSSRASESRDT